MFTAPCLTASALISAKIVAPKGWKRVATCDGAAASGRVGALVEVVMPGG